MAHVQQWHRFSKHLCSNSVWAHSCQVPVFASFVLTAHVSALVCMQQTKHAHVWGLLATEFACLQSSMLTWSYLAAVLGDPGTVPHEWHPFSTDQVRSACDHPELSTYSHTNSKSCTFASIAW